MASVVIIVDEARDPIKMGVFSLEKVTRALKNNCAVPGLDIAFITEALGCIG